MHKSVLYLICTCEQPSAPGSYRPPGKAGGYPRKKKATCLQSFKCSFSAGTLGDGGGRPNKFEKEPSRIGSENLTDGMKTFIFGKMAD